jgi:hypothetical protein
MVTPYLISLGLAGTTIDFNVSCQRSSLNLNLKVHYKAHDRNLPG